MGKEPERSYACVRSHCMKEICAAILCNMDAIAENGGSVLPRCDAGGIPASAVQAHQGMYRTQLQEYVEPPPTIGLLGIIPAKPRHEDPELARLWTCVGEEKYVPPADKPLAEFDVRLDDNKSRIKFVRQRGTDVVSGAETQVMEFKVYVVNGTETLDTAPCCVSVCLAADKPELYMQRDVVSDDPIEAHEQPMLWNRIQLRTRSATDAELIVYWPKNRDYELIWEMCIDCPNGAAIVHSRQADVIVLVQHLTLFAAINNLEMVIEMETEASNNPTAQADMAECAREANTVSAVVHGRPGSE